MASVTLGQGRTRGWQGCGFRQSMNRDCRQAPRVEVKVGFSKEASSRIFDGGNRGFYLEKFRGGMARLLFWSMVTDEFPERAEVYLHGVKYLECGTDFTGFELWEAAHVDDLGVDWSVRMSEEPDWPTRGFWIVTSDGIGRVLASDYATDIRPANPWDKSILLGDI